MLSKTSAKVRRGLLTSLLLLAIPPAVSAQSIIDARRVEFSLGKPSPDPDGMIRLDYVALLRTALTPGVVYESVVSAVGWWLGAKRSLEHFWV